MKLYFSMFNDVQNSANFDITATTVAFKTIPVIECQDVVKFTTCFIAFIKQWNLNDNIY